MRNHHRSQFVLLALVASACTTSVDSPPPTEAPEDLLAQIEDELDDGAQPDSTSPIGSGDCGYMGVTSIVNGMLGQNYDICVLSWCDSDSYTCLDCAGGRNFDVHKCWDL